MPTGPMGKRENTHVTRNGTHDVRSAQERFLIGRFKGKNTLPKFIEKAGMGDRKDKRRLIS